MKKSKSMRTAIALLTLSVPVTASAIGNVGIERVSAKTTSAPAPVTNYIGNVGIE